MLIGVPAAGKTTWVKQNKDGNTLVASSDDFIERYADEHDKTYNDVFHSMIKKATQYAKEVAQQAYDLKMDLILDQTNLTRKSRAGKMVNVPKDYEKIAVYFPTPPSDIHKKRLDSRPGKNIPAHIITSMISTLEPPNKDEGFNKIIVAE
jgi:hypothetical protein